MSPPTLSSTPAQAAASSSTPSLDGVDEALYAYGKAEATLIRCIDTLLARDAGAHATDVVRDTIKMLTRRVGPEPHAVPSAAGERGTSAASAAPKGRSRAGSGAGVEPAGMRQGGAPRRGSISISASSSASVSDGRRSVPLPIQGQGQGPEAPSDRRYGSDRSTPTSGSTFTASSSSSAGGAGAYTGAQALLQPPLPGPLFARRASGAAPPVSQAALPLAPSAWSTAVTHAGAMPLPAGTNAAAMPMPVPMPMPVASIPPSSSTSTASVPQTLAPIPMPVSMPAPLALHASSLTAHSAAAHSQSFVASTGLFGPLPLTGTSSSRTGMVVAGSTGTPLPQPLPAAPLGASLRVETGLASGPFGPSVNSLSAFSGLGMDLSPTNLGLGLALSMPVPVPASTHMPITMPMPVPPPSSQLASHRGNDAGGLSGSSLSGAFANFLDGDE